MAHSMVIYWPKVAIPGGRPKREPMTRSGIATVPLKVERLAAPKVDMRRLCSRMPLYPQRAVGVFFNLPKCTAQ